MEELYFSQLIDLSVAMLPTITIKGIILTIILMTFGPIVLILLDSIINGTYKVVEANGDTLEDTLLCIHLFRRGRWNKYKSTFYVK